MIFHREMRRSINALGDTVRLSHFGGRLTNVLGQNFYAQGQFEYEVGPRYVGQSRHSWNSFGLSLAGRELRRAKSDKSVTENSTVRKIPANHLVTISAFTDPNRKVSSMGWAGLLVGSRSGDRSFFIFRSAMDISCDGQFKAEKLNRIYIR